MATPGPLFARAPNPDRVTVECRPKLSLELAAVIDGARQADAHERRRAVTREEKVIEILTAWAVAEQRRATLIYRATRGNPQPLDSESEP